jgi:ketosteroid isomerase-like protein
MKLYGAVVAFVLGVGVAMPGRAEPARLTPVMDVSQQWAGYWNAKNLDAVMALYAPEPNFMPTIGEAWTGVTSIRKEFAGVLAVYDPHIVLHSLRSETSGTLAYDSGNYEETVAPVKGGAAIRTSGSYLFVFQKQKHGGWKILEQAWTEREPVKF